MDEVCKIWPRNNSVSAWKRRGNENDRPHKKNKNKIGLIDHAWYMSPGFLTSLTCFMAQ